jgi:hypothetical protein
MFSLRGHFLFELCLNEQQRLQLLSNYKILFKTQHDGLPSYQRRTPGKTTAERA